MIRRSLSFRRNKKETKNSDEGAKNDHNRSLSVVEEVSLSILVTHLRERLKKRMNHEKRKEIPRSHFSDSCITNPSEMTQESILSHGSSESATGCMQETDGNEMPDNDAVMEGKIFSAHVDGLNAEDIPKEEVEI